MGSIPGAVLGGLLIGFVESFGSTPGFWLLMSVGQLSMAQAAFMGVGAYASTLLVMSVGLSFWLGLVLAGVFTAIFGAVVSLPLFRLRGIYFAIATFGLGEVLRLVWTRWVDLFGGAAGIAGIPGPGSIVIGKWLTVTFGRGSWSSYYYLALTITFLAVVVLYRLHGSRIGMTFRAIGQQEVMARSVGVDTAWQKVVAFAVACFFAGMAGSFNAHYILYVSPQYFTLHDSMNIIVWTVVGGSFVPAGAIVGPLVLVTLSEALSFMREYMPLVYGAMLIITIMVFPGGLASVPNAIEAWIAKSRRVLKPK